MSDPLHQTARLFAALSDETRLRLAYALRDGERCVCQLIALVGLAPSTVSKHLALLREAGLVESRKEGRWVYYRLADFPAFPLAGKRSVPLVHALEQSPALRADQKALKRICREKMDDLCKRLTRKG